MNAATRSRVITDHRELARCPECNRLVDVQNCSHFPRHYTINSGGSWRCNAVGTMILETDRIGEVR